MYVVGYARVSTRAQVESGSLEQQINKILSYCDARNHKLIEMYTDGGISALGDRKAWHQAIDMVQRQPKPRAIVVTKLDRWGRSVQDLVTSINQLEQNDVQFISIDDSIDTTTTNGRLLFHILSAFAEFDRENIRERLIAGRERAKAEGKQLHRPRKTLDVKEIVRLYDLGLSATAIGKIMHVHHATILSRLRENGVKIK